MVNYCLHTTACNLFNIITRFSQSIAQITQFQQLVNFRVSLLQFWRSSIIFIFQNFLFFPKLSSSKKFWKMNIIDDLQNNEPRRRIFNEIATIATFCKIWTHKSPMNGSSQSSKRFLEKSFLSLTSSLKCIHSGLSLPQFWRPPASHHPVMRGWGEHCNKMATVWLTL